MIFILVSLSLKAELMYEEPVTARQGQAFKIYLDLPDKKRGFDWNWSNKKELQGFVDLSRSIIDEHIDPTLTIISPPTKIFTFRALKPGKKTLKFAKSKTWENKKVGERRIKIHIKRADRKPVPPKNNYV